MKHRCRVLMFLIIALICAVIFAGCGDKTIRGEVTGVNTDAQTGAVRFVLEQDDGELITVVTDKDSHIFSWIDEVSESDLRTGAVEGIMVSVTGRMSGSTMHATQVQIDQLLVRDAHTLEDGTQIDVLIGSTHLLYCHQDGTELLMVRTPIGPDCVHVGGVESLDLLPQKAQQNILAYYNAQGILYDEFKVLEEAYTAYQILKDDFQTFTLGQEIVPTASNDEIIYFLTVVTMPDNGPHGDKELRLGAAFDKETGKKIPVLDLFTCEPEEIIPLFAEICKLDDEALISEMKANFRPEYVVFFPDNLEITFPAGVLEVYGTSFAMGFDYGEETYDALLQPWAIPCGSRPVSYND